MSEHVFRVMEVRGEVRLEVARVAGPDPQRALREALHYVAMYAQDGPVVLEQRWGKRWRQVAA